MYGFENKIDSPISYPKVSIKKSSGPGQVTIKSNWSPSYKVLFKLLEKMTEKYELPVEPHKGIYINLYA